MSLVRMDHFVPPYARRWTWGHARFSAPVSHAAVPVSAQTFVGHSALSFGEHVSRSGIAAITWSFHVQPCEDPVDRCPHLLASSARGRQLLCTLAGTCCCLALTVAVLTAESSCSLVPGPPPPPHGNSWPLSPPGSPAQDLYTHERQWSWGQGT